jgi:hypothetical protein
LAPLLLTLLELPFGAAAQSTADAVNVRMFIEQTGDRLHLLIRVPLGALGGISLPFRNSNGELDLDRAEAQLPGIARWWIADKIEIYDGDTRLPQPAVTATRISLPADNAFESYEEALAHIKGPGLARETQVFREQAMLDVSLEEPILAGARRLAIHSRLARLGERVSTELQFTEPNGQIRRFDFDGDPGLFPLDASRSEAIRWFAPLGFRLIVKGSDYLLFLFCVALLLRSATALISFMAAFALTHSATLIASAFNLATDALWFPTLIETLIAVSVVYLAFENIAGGLIVRRRWALALPLGLGLIYGFSFGFGLLPALPFGGSHRLASVLAYNGGIEVGQALVLALFAPALALLFRATPNRQRIETIVLAALAADMAWNRVTDRISRLNQFRISWPPLDAALLADAMRWAAILLVVGGIVFVVLALRGHRGSRSV